MTQLSLFEAEEFYEFPKDFLEYMENFLNREEANLLKKNIGYCFLGTAYPENTR